MVKKSLSPNWDESYDFRGTLGAMRSDALTLTVYDHDGLSFNDILGEASVTLGLTKLGYSEEIALPLWGKKATGRPTTAGTR